jgi:hypothetical protein
VGGWQLYSVAEGNKRGGWEKLLPGFAPSMFLGVLGGTGITAYFGLLRVGLPKAGETVLVSGAAGGARHSAAVALTLCVRSLITRMHSRRLGGGPDRKDQGLSCWYAPSSQTLNR